MFERRRVPARRCTRSLACAQKRKKKNKCTILPLKGVRRSCTCREACRGHRRHLEKQEQRERAEMKRRTKAPHSAPRHCYFKRFSSKTRRRGTMRSAEHSLGALCPEQHSQLFQQAEERWWWVCWGAGVESKSREASGGRAGVRDRNTGGDKAPRPPEALVFTAPLAQMRRGKHASTRPELEGALCAALQLFKFPSTTNTLQHRIPLHTLLRFRMARGEKEQVE